MINQPDIFRSTVAKIFTLLTGASMMLSTMDVAAFGYVSSPKSRAAVCREDGPTPDNPVSAACQAALLAGNYSIYEPWAISIYGVDNNHQAFVPDGKLCSANSVGLSGLDLARDDWPATQVSAGPLTFSWTHLAMHKTSYFRYYITKEGFDPLQPLKWSDLEQIHQSAPAGQQAISNHLVTLPSRTGRHIVYSVWQRDRSDAAQAFYQCVDVVYPDTNNSSNSFSSASSTTTSRSSSSIPNDDACAQLSLWDANTAYIGKQQVKYNGRRYTANYWTRGNIPSENAGTYNYWLDIGSCSEPTSSQSSSSKSSVASSRSSSSVSTNCTSPIYINGTTYTSGALVQNNGSEYRCVVGGWCSQGGAYAPGSGWAWPNAWTLVRSCQ